MRYFGSDRQYFRKSRFAGTKFEGEDDPLASLPNLFDLCLVFIVGLLVTIFSAYHMQDLFDKDSELTIMKKSDSGQMEIITKKGEEIDARKVSPKKAKGRGQRLGVAYRLQDGSMVYLPEEKMNKGKGGS
ncbi:MAG: DUF2149 domain-containing protein [Thermodesulfobacteriota bacterium]